MNHLKRIFQRIDKSKYPKAARRWSFSAFVLTPVFVIGNKLWFFTAVYFFVYFYRVFIVRTFFNKFTIILMFCIFAAYFVIAVYLLIYGRILAWEKLGYNDKESDILKFQQRQKAILFWGILLLIVEIVALYFYLSLIGFE